MKSILSKKIHKDDRGLSLVEVLCAVAILSLIAGVIGSVIVISSRTYRRGISETNIQQEAQLAANNIGNIVKNSYKVIYGADGNVLVESTEKDGDKPVEDGKSWDPRYTELSLITNEDIQYTMLYDRDAKVLVYQEYDTVKKEKRTDPQVMASKISKFEADTSMFKENRTIKLTMEIEDESTNRSIPMEYVMTSRNSEGEGEYVSSTDSLRIAFLEDEVVLVPGETSAEIPIMVMGTVSGAMEFKTEDGNKVEDILGTGSVTMSDDYTSVKVAVSRTVTDAVANNGVSFRICTRDASGNEVKSSLFKVHIRKVEKVAVNWTVDVSHTDSDKHMYEEKGSVFTFSAGVTGNRLAKDVAKDYDLHYKTAQAVKWSWVVKDGDKEYTEADGSSNELITVTETQEDTEVPKIVIKLNQNMSSGFSLTVTATSKHAHGENKASSSYYDAVEAEKEHYYGSATVTPREAVPNEEFEITLEPYEAGIVELGMKGGRPKEEEVTFDYIGSSDSTGTTAVYDPVNDIVTVTLGKDEKGSGAGGAEPYTFKIGMNVNGVLKTTITVHVRRIDKIWVEIVQDKEVPKTYDFRARINVDKPQPNKQVTTNYLYDVIKANPDDADAKKIVAQTLSSKITWEFYDYNKSKTKPQYSDWTICEGGVGTKREVTEKSPGFKEEREYYQLTKGLKNSVKPARIQIYTEEDRNKDIAEGNSRASEVKVGEWYIRQYPEVDLTLKKGSLPANTELRVTIEMLHSQGNNKSNSTYHNRQEWVVYASESIFGNRIYTDSEIVVVEPGQGTNSATQSDEEIVIPIHSEGEDQDDKIVDHMIATVENSKKTRLSEYKNDDKTNPYCYTERTSKGNSEWYLGLVIDKEEKGDDNGFITVKVEAYDKDNTLLTQMNFKLAVRRVNNVGLQVKDEVKFSDINEAGSTVTLGAYPTGEGGKGKKEGEGEVKDGTAYYGVQTKSDTDDYMGFDITIKDEDVDTSSTVCRWEKKDHGRYKSPFAMEWTMVINGRERALSEWTEYIEKPVLDTVPEEYKATVTFKLKKPLPSGARIRAYSLHARGKVGNTKYNKSGKEYDEVYGELVIGDRKLLGGFMRARMRNYTLPGFEWGVIPQFKAKYFNTNDFQQYTFYRYREVDGEWSQYYKTDDNENYHAYVTGNRMARLFRTDKEYELDVVNVLYNTTEKAIYWPQDNSLLESGAGWKEAGYILKNWDYSSKFTESELAFECKQEYLIPKTEMYFDPSPGNQTIASSVQTVGSETNPIQVDGNGQGDSSKWFAVRMNPTAFDLPAAYADFIALLYKKVGNEWVEIPDVKNLQSTDHWLLQAQNPTITVGYTYGAKGTYRICSYLKGMDWTDVSGDMFNPTYKTSYEDLPLYNLSDNTGVLYVELK